MLFSARKATSSCTGAATSDMALAVVEKTVNDSGGGPDGRFVDLKISSAHVTKSCFNTGFDSYLCLC